MKEGKTRTVTTVILKSAVIVSVIAGLLLSFGAARGSFMSGSRIFMYFTIQSNILIGLICLAGLFFLSGKIRPDGRWAVSVFVGTVSITLTGLVFCFILAPTLGAGAWSMHNILTHVSVPLFSIADFFVMGRDYRIGKNRLVYITIPPLLYVIYAGIAYVKGWEFSSGHNYPYFFLNWGSPAGAFGFKKGFPFMGCVWWIAAILLLLLAVGSFYLWLLGKVNEDPLPEDDR
ncbi:MAG: Pr6Pr family membrane protein [Lachnospiraceae bacterium]|nr:Pr6Pr family membrane protein [Lachnospiraceae bacterium]